MFIELNSLQGSEGIHLRLLNTVNLRYATQMVTGIKQTIRLFAKFNILYTHLYTHFGVYFLSKWFNSTGGLPTCQCR